KFLLDATYKGYYTEEVMDAVTDILLANNGEIHITEEDLAHLDAAKDLNDFLGINYYQSNFVRAYDGDMISTIMVLGRKARQFSRYMVLVSKCLIWTSLEMIGIG